MEPELDLESVEDGLMVLAAAQLMQRNIEFSVGKAGDRGYVFVGEGDSFELWLTNLTAWARANPRDQWPAKVAEWGEFVVARLPGGNEK
ncbi:hypothetical protein [Rarobacter incanus]|uniref:Uncharacterized protein n=1 Tax=Rarobacter incanus TaxID=153494 RepID=A0A542SQ97_9MICO|nr:hypothetical protein [Rarobacter incanus]TQK76765.1 hypothetical protein FB389_1455 [Rarobacter incanus]